VVARYRPSQSHRLALLLAFVSACGRASLDDAPPDDDGGSNQGASSQGGSSQGGSSQGGSSQGGSSQGGSSQGGGGAGTSNGGGGTGGGTSSCLVAQECEDGDPCTSNLCVGGQCVFPLRDDDQDGAVASACGGADCNDLNPSVFPGAPENCTDGSDNDCNGVADCNDPSCTSAPLCGCTPAPESCQNGVDDDCDGTVDCLDAACQGTPVCGCLTTEAGLCGNGFDDDCDGLIDCDDPTCASTPQCQCQATPEFCGDGQDNDCDLLVDCADPQCQGVFPCACQPPGSPEQCSDGVDNDCDTLPDCSDSQCLTSPACSQCSPEQCSDGVDNDCDLLIDCADSACTLTPGCQPVPEVCNNGLDDDFDGTADCSDPDCANTPICKQKQANCLSPKLISGSGTYTGDTTGNSSETKGSCGGDAGEAVFYFVLNAPSYVQLSSLGTSFDSTLYVRTGACNTGKEIGCDDDSAGQLGALLTFDILYPGTYYVFLDGFTVDPQGGANEGPFQLAVDIVANPPETCGDGKDNDGDIYVDCADSDCTSVGACLNCNAGLPPSPEFGPGRCTDGKDNDCDGTVDCGDEDCSASDYYVTECCNGLDETGNGVIDDFNCRCANSSECSNGQLCYDHTAYACGIPCGNFFGDVCPFVAPGSYCNATTQQCEFP
jgi:hypothetical protein